MSLEEIKKYLWQGDMVEIARLTGFSHQYVRQVLNKNDRRKNEEIIKMAIETATWRKARRVLALEELIGEVTEDLRHV